MFYYKHSKCRIPNFRTASNSAANFSGDAPPEEPARKAITTNDLLQEALWWLCHIDKSLDASDPPAKFTDAIEALCRFELHRHEASALESKVIQYIELLFPDGLTETQVLLLIGWLSKRAIVSEESRRLFSTRELLQEIGILQDAISLTPGTLKEWRILWNELPTGFRSRTRLRLGNDGKSIPAERVQSLALDALAPTSLSNLVILAPGGAGKSTFLAQVAQNDEFHNNVFCCGADDPNLDELDQLTKAIRFCAALLALRKPESQLLICIDGLDEADPPLRKRWAKILVRISSLSNVRAVISMRDADWRNDGGVRNELSSWPRVFLDLWPEALIRELLSTTPYYAALQESTIDLLRTPILLDLFWRTFVEIESPNITRASHLQTRHSLLKSFWHERLVESPRHIAVTEIIPKITEILALSASRIGGFPQTNLDEIAVRILLSEGVLVREGNLNIRLRFRHPLLRDFALAQWCLESSDSPELSRRWNSIHGGLQRHGVLRAIMDALTDQDAKSEYPLVTIGDFVQEAVLVEPKMATQLAFVLGTREATASLDPAGWPSSVQFSLPNDFARDLLSTARLNGNITWSRFIEKWPDDAPWLNGDYPFEVWRYATFLAGNLKNNAIDPELHERCHQVMRKLRNISETSRFSAEFSKSDRWLKMQAMLCVIPALPNEATLAWIERELLHSTWRTRTVLFETLIHLAQLDAPRTAIIYRKSIGLSHQGNQPLIDISYWSGIMTQQAIDGSLAGENGRSLLKEHPHSFIPIALDLAEALWILKHQDSENYENIINSDRRILIDDSYESRFWAIKTRNEAYDSCLRAIDDATNHCLKINPSNFNQRLSEK